jgi:tetratricopeptide (TPR) repeat protein
MITRCEGARSRDPQKYTKDAAILEAALVENPGDSRTLFYLAQSYRDAGNREEARRVYGAYLDLSEGVGWNQERYMAIVNLIGLEDDSQDQMDLAWKAVELCPDRLEAPYTLLRRRRLEGRPVLRQTYALASVCRNRKVAADWLFATPAVYEWGMDDELAVVAFALGHYQEAYDAAMRCVLNGPAETRENAMRNARAALNKMQGLP